MNKQTKNLTHAHTHKIVQVLCNKSTNTYPVMNLLEIH